MVPTAISHSGSTVNICQALTREYHLKSHKKSHTDQSFLAEAFGFLGILLPLEDTKGLVDQWQHIDGGGLSLALHLNSLVELVNGSLEILLIKKQFAIVIVHIRNVFKLLDRALECSHGRGDRAELVLGHTKLDVRVNECRVEVNGLLVVLGSLGKFAKDEVELCTVVVNIRVIFVVCNGKLKVVDRSVLVSCFLSVGI